MTEVRYRNSRNRHELEITGHHADRVACAGISSIAWALAGAAANVSEIDDLVMEDGYIHICVGDRGKTGKALYNFFFMAYIGLRQIELEYPGTISFK